MNIKKEQLSESQMKLTISVTQDEAQKYLERAAKKLSLKHKIKGFRPGKASYDVIKQQFGEMTIYQEALNPIINNTLIDAMKQENVDYVGQPNIDVEKLAPDNDIVYTAIFDLMPTVELPKDWKSLKVKVKQEEVKADKIKEVIDGLAARQAKQILKEDKAAKGDKVILDFELSFDNVVPENGTAQNFEVVIGDEKMIPGFEDQLVDTKAGDKKEFEVPFPENYYQKDFAGKKGKFKITVQHVFTMEKPELNDEFAKGLGMESFEKLEEQIKENLQHELRHQHEHDAEVEMFELMAGKSTFSTIPESMVETEKDTMIREMQQNIMRQGLSFDDYLSHMKKSVEDLKKDMQEDAYKRVQSGLILKTIREEEKIDVSDADVDAELQKALESTKDDKKMQEQLNSPQYRLYIKNSLAIQKVTKLMKDTLLEGLHSCEH